MARLSALQARKLPSSFGQDTRQDIEEKKKVFQESVDRVKQQFFGYQRENVCSDIEKVRGHIFLCCSFLEPLSLFGKPKRKTFELHFTQN